MPDRDLAARPVTLVPYRPEWITLFAAERDLILGTCAKGALRLEHIGSTAVPHLIAKPTIDILGGVARIEDVHRLLPCLQQQGYVYVPEYERELPERRYFYKGRNGEDEFHLHIVEWGTPFWVRHLAFRDYLRQHPATAAKYGELKRRLAQDCGPDREGYTNGKTGFIRRVEQAAARERDHRKG